jgi:hypothetical protein
MLPTVIASRTPPATSNGTTVVRVVLLVITLAVIAGFAISGIAFAPWNSIPEHWYRQPQHHHTAEQVFAQTRSQLAHSQQHQQQHEQHYIDIKHGQQVQLLSAVQSLQQQLLAASEKLQQQMSKLDVWHAGQSSTHTHTGVDELDQQGLSHFPAACTSAELSKQSCLFSNVCLQQRADHQGLTAMLHGHAEQEHADLLKQHLARTFHGIAADVNITASVANSTMGSDLKLEPPTIVWRAVGANQYSFGHALVNEALSAFLVLQNHFQSIPESLQLLNVAGWHPVLQHVLAGTITRNAYEFNAKVPAESTVCFKQLLLGDGGYPVISRSSLEGGSHAAMFDKEPSFFSSANWRNFRDHSMKVSVALRPDSDRTPAERCVSQLLCISTSVNGQMYHCHLNMF